MTRNKPQMYGVAIAAGAVVAVWGGLSLWLLLILLVCPVSMFFMMRGMNRSRTGVAAYSRRRSPKGLHQRIDHPCATHSTPGEKKERT